MNTTEVLKKALDVLHERGWHQGWYQGPNGEVCGYGALRLSMTKGEFFAEDKHPALRAVDAQVGGYFPLFNDDPTTTKEDVIMVFEQAILESKREDV